MNMLKKVLLSFPNLSMYELFCIIIPLAIINFSFDYLSDGQVVKDELKIGIINFIHHIFAFCSVFFGFMFGMFFTNNPYFIIMTTLIFIGIHVGFLINDNICWMTILINKIINPEKPLRKWRGADPMAYIKHYIRGDEWGYSDIHVSKKDKYMLIVGNLAYLLLSLKLYVINSK